MTAACDTPPEWLAAAVATGSREVVRQQEVKVDLDWWARALNRVPGGPITGRRDGVQVDRGRAVISRGDVWSHAETLSEPADGLPLLWHALAWGSGLRLRNNGRRIASVSTDAARVGAELVEAGHEARTSPEDAYQRLWRGAGRVAYLGPAFFTKLLYFSGAGRADHPSLILDGRVAASLRNEGIWPALSSGGWSADTYARYCALLASWAKRLTSELGQAVSADELELQLFRGKAQASSS